MYFGYFFYVLKSYKICILYFKYSIVIFPVIIL
uniref:Uncharacterized protein n=1 Tax=Siphoviridae sp. ctiOl67 TaxID=2825622 RepID=A0A8S5QJI6_9CAUD|nr:MAG TPA: hypothetical protein [Siphoviridae sp. ctiOl67]